jgi:hypothetical protein
VREKIEVSTPKFSNYFVAYMRFEVPQFIEVEDKVVGPLTWRQFIYLAGGIGILIVIWFSMPLIGFVILGIPLGALAGFLAFHRINNRPFSLFLESFVSYWRKGRLYLWKKEEEQTIMSFTSESEVVHGAVQGDRRRLTSLAEKLEFYSTEK